MARIFKATTWGTVENYTYVKMKNSRMKFSFDILSTSFNVRRHSKAEMVITEFATTLTDFISSKKFDSLTPQTGDTMNLLSLYEFFKLEGIMTLDEYISMMGLDTETRNASKVRHAHVTLKFDEYDAHLISLDSWFFKNGQTVKLHAVFQEYLNTNDGRNVYNTLLSMFESWKFELIMVPLHLSTNEFCNELYNLMSKFNVSPYTPTGSVSDSYNHHMKMVANMRLLINEISTNACEFVELLELAQSHDVEEVESSTKKLKDLRIKINQKLKEIQ